MDNHGGMVVGVVRNGKGSGARVANLVLRAFVGPPKKVRGVGQYPVHKDGDWTNCRLDNLEWGFKRNRDSLAKEEPSRRSCCWCEAVLPRGRKHARCADCAREYNEAWRNGGKEATKKLIAEKGSNNARMKWLKEPYPLRLEKLIERYIERKIPLAEAAEKADVHPHSFNRYVRNYRKHHGIRPPTRREWNRWAWRTRKNNRHPPNELRKEAAEYAVKHGAREASEKYGYAERTIVRWKGRFGLTGKSELE